MSSSQAGMLVNELLSGKNIEKNLEELKNVFGETCRETSEFAEILKSSVDAGVLEVMESLSRSRNRSIRELDFELSDRVMECIKELRSKPSSWDDVESILPKLLKNRVHYDL